MVVIKTYGRTVIYANYTEKELLSGKNDQIVEKVLDILTNAIPLHQKNKAETRYLWDYYTGNQDIYVDKQKLTRTEIDHKVVENWAYAFVDFKKTFLLGKPIQYVQSDSSASEEISTLNDYVKYENKKSKDLDIYEDILVNGNGYRYTNTDKPTDDDEAPFEIINCDPALTEVVYSSKLGNEQLLSFIETSMKYIVTTVNPETGAKENQPRYYSEYTVYLRNKKLVFNDKNGDLQLVPDSVEPITINEHIISEYYVNRNRISLIELGKDIFNAINNIESLDLDDMDAFVNNLLVFINCEATEEDLKGMAELGAVNITSTDQKKASIETVQQRLKADGTQIHYNRLLTALHQILGIPMASDSGTIESGDTGKAKLTGQGYTSATIRIEGDETKFGDCDKQCLKVILKICKNSADSEIKSLKLIDVEPKFQRDVSDNLLVKTQGLMNLLECKIPKKYALAIPNLFSDVEAVVSDMEKEEKERQEQFEQDQIGSTNGSKTNPDDKANEQNNEITNIEQKDNQEQ